nr:hypothetical protein [Rickettsia tamurae]
MTSSTGRQASYSSLANKIKVSIPTITRWLESFESFFIVIVFIHGQIIFLEV